MTQLKAQCKAHLFSGTGENEYHIWVLCEDCAREYIVDDSPIHHMGEAQFSDVMSCDKCNKNLFFDEDQYYIDKAQEMIDPEERQKRDTDPAAPCSHKDRRLSLIKVKEVFGLTKKTA